MEKVLDMKGKQVFEVNGYPFRAYIKYLEEWHQQLAKQQMDHNDVLRIYTSVGYVDFCFNE